MIEFDDQNNDILKGYSMLLSFSGSFILNQPQQICINDLAGSNIFRNLPVKSDNPSFILASSFLNNINSDKRVDYTQIQKDHLDLFGGSGESKAPPYESVYRSAEHLLYQEQTLQVRHIYETYGWKSTYNGTVPDDHIGIELQFLILLLDKLHKLDDSICRVELTKDLRKFISDHLIKWVPQWNRDLQKNATSNLYKGIGYLVVGSIEDLLTIT
ncbi:MAG TPA: molecular chaperone TorD family protein [Bacteroidales bacterium]|nr:molecular chaperone TorD family protein [Bacteroidales bacterium]